MPSIFEDQVQFKHWDGDNTEACWGGLGSWWASLHGTERWQWAYGISSEAGWNGSSSGVLSKAIKEMIKSCSSRDKNYDCVSPPKMLGWCAPWISSFSYSIKLSFRSYGWRGLSSRYSLYVSSFGIACTLMDPLMVSRSRWKSGSSRGYSRYYNKAVIPYSIKLLIFSINLNKMY